MQHLAFIKTELLMFWQKFWFVSWILSFGDQEANLMHFMDVRNGGNISSVSALLLTSIHISDCNMNYTRNPVVHKKTLNPLPNHLINK